MDIDEDLVESDIHLQITTFPSGERDFCLCKMDQDGSPVPLNPIELLVLDRAADAVEEEKKTNKPKAMNLALCRLLVPSVKTKRVGRHLVHETWSEQAVRGETLAKEVRTAFAKELSQEQADLYQVMQSSQGNPANFLLKELFWDAVAELPKLSRQFDNPELGKFGKALYFYLIPSGEGREELESWSDLTKKIKQSRANDFRELELSYDRAHIRRLFRLYIAVTIRWTSKLTGQIASALIDDLRVDSSPMSTTEQMMLELRYGAAECFGKINVGYVSDCGPLFESFFNDIFRCIADRRPESECGQAMNSLLRFVYLHHNYLDLRKHARRQEKQGQREHFQDKLPAKREAAENLVLARTPAPSAAAVMSEEMMLLKEHILPEVERSKPNQANLLQSYIDHMGDMESAASALGMSVRQLTRKLKETVFPTCQKVARRLNLHELLED